MGHLWFPAQGQTWRVHFCKHWDSATPFAHALSAFALCPQSGQLRHTLRGHDRKWQVPLWKKGLATEDTNWYRVKPTRSTFPLLHQPHGEDARFRATGPSGSRAPSDIQQMAMSHGAEADVLKAKGSHGPDSLPATDLSSADCLQRPYITSVPPHMGVRAGEGVRPAGTLL